jgi:RNA polymerase sigma-B factor
MSSIGQRRSRGGHPAASGRTRDHAHLTSLFERWQRDGDRRAREQLTEMFLPLARNLARRYVGAQEPIDDLVQVASLGLVKAIDRYDASRGIAFSSYAVPTILGELRRYFRDTGWAVHVPRGAQERALLAEKALRTLTSESGHTPSVRELAQYLEWNVSEALDALEAAAAHHASSLDAPTRGQDEEDGLLVETLGAPDERLDLVEARVSVEAVAHDLSERDRQVLRLRFIGDLTQSQIGAEIGVSQMQVSRILRSALARLHELTDGSERSAAA